MIQQILAIWSLVHLPFLKPAWTSESSQFTYWGGPIVKSISTAFVKNCFVLYYVRGIIHHDLTMINFINLGSYAKCLMSNVKLSLDTCIEQPYCFNTSYTPGAFLVQQGWSLLSPFMEKAYIPKSWCYEKALFLFFSLAHAHCHALQVGCQRPFMADKISFRGIWFFNWAW